MSERCAVTTVLKVAGLLLWRLAVLYRRWLREYYLNTGGRG
jgi:hypothetical protein